MVAHRSKDPNYRLSYFISGVYEQITPSNVASKSWRYSRTTISNTTVTSTLESPIAVHSPRPTSEGLSHGGERRVVVALDKLSKASGIDDRPLRGTERQLVAERSKTNDCHECHPRQSISDSVEYVVSNFQSAKIKMPPPSAPMSKHENEMLVQSQPSKDPMSVNYEDLSPEPHNPPNHDLKRGRDISSHIPTHISGLGVETSDDFPWPEILRLRSEVSTLRSQSHGLRAQLRLQQNIKSNAEDALCQRLNYLSLRHAIQLPPAGPSLDEVPLETLGQDLQTVRDQYGPMEDECGMLEDHLSRQEFRLTRLESYLLPLPEQQGTTVVKTEKYTFPAYTSHAPSSNSSQTDNTGGFGLHPDVTSYLTRLGQLELLQERLFARLDEKETLDSQFTVDEEEREWLENFPNEQAKLISEIDDSKVEIDDLRTTLQSAGFLDENGEPTTLQEQEQHAFITDSEIEAQGQVSEYTKYPRLIPWCDTDLESPTNLDLANTTEFVPDQATIRVNQWILQRLRTSPMEVHLLERIFLRTSGPIRANWENAVLFFWHEDGTLSQRTEPRTYESTLSSEKSGNFNNPPSKGSNLFHVLIARKPKYSADDPKSERLRLDTRVYTISVSSRDPAIYISEMSLDIPDDYIDVRPISPKALTT